MASQSDQTSIDINMEYLCQHWVHSYEEQQNPYAVEDQIYRPKDFKVIWGSGRRGRGAYILFKDGDCQWLHGPGPDDRSYFETGKWRMDPNDKSILLIEKYFTPEPVRTVGPNDKGILQIKKRFAPQHVRTETYRIVELTKDRLRMILLHGVNAA
jgi:hypothetical protein